MRSDRRHERNRSSRSSGSASAIACAIAATTRRYATLRDAIAGAVRGAVPLAADGAGAADDDRGLLGAARRVVRRRDRRGRRHHRPQRRRQEHAAQDPLPHHRADRPGASTLRGRVASLLEVGTGFHPELTGRENIFLNGAILGMTRAEIRRKFDEIVAFADVERFLDTPVKRYSTGMYVRLAFAVAAHLEPEILIVDEVLAVGDAEFQKKCLGKMHDVSRGGRTVLFVSHNMAAVQALCQRAIWLDGGRVAADGAHRRDHPQLPFLVRVRRHGGAGPVRLGPSLDLGIRAYAEPGGQRRRGRFHVSS